MTAEPHGRTLDALRREAAGCTGCHLHERATQTVFGEGPEHAEVMLVGEQPGDREDREGHPFVGPAGRVLDEALVEAGIDRTRVYVTNAVKHFKWVPAERGKRRIHKTPNTPEVRACHPWLDAEITAVKPRVIVALGATAAKSLFGPTVRVTVQRGRVLRTPLAEAGFATVHPSAILRAPGDLRADAEKAFVADLKKVARYLASHGG
jgi:uracil-DNA glycosylase